MVAIKGLKMPKSCYKCEFVRCETVVKDEGNVDYFQCRRTHTYCKHEKQERNDDCPLIEVEDGKM